MGYRTKRTMTTTYSSPLISALEYLPATWALTPILDKSPLRPDWQTESPVTRAELIGLLEKGQHLWSHKKQKNWHCKWTGYGLLTGDRSGGLIAIDQDGPTAGILLEQLSGGDLPLTPAWTSGKRGKRQLVYQLPPEVQARLHNFNRGVLTDGCAEGELLELRYNRCQSALPPSRHPETGGYRWIDAANHVPVAPAPQWLCELVLQFAEREQRAAAAKAAEQVNRGPAQTASENPWDIRNFVQFLEGGSSRRQGWSCYKCPAHNGVSDDSLHVEDSSGAFKCHADCDSKQVYHAAKEIAIAHGYQLPESRGGQGNYFVLPGCEKLTADFTGNARYVSDVMVQVEATGLAKNKRLIVVKSAHNTGKTHWLKGYFAQFQGQHIPIWPLTYRQSLERAYGAAFGVPTRAESAEYKDSMEVTGATMCIHSMRPDSASRFDGNISPVGAVSLDECRGILQELTDSNLVKRAKVLPHFTAHLQRCSEAGYPIVALDAALTDIEVNCLTKLLGLSRDQVLVVENTFQPWKGKTVIQVDDLKSNILKLKEFLRDGGGPIWITTSGQQPKSKSGSLTLENVCLSINRGLKILRVDSETVHRTSHPAAKLMVLLEQGGELINDFLKLWDVVIISPVIESGVSVELFNHFKAQFSFVSGGLRPENTVQQLLRLRDNSVPIYLGSPERGLDCTLKRGNGSPEVKTFRNGELEKQRGNMHQLLVPTFEIGLNTSFIDYWLEVATRSNGSIPMYKKMLVHHLESVGCEVVEDDSQFSKSELKAQSLELANITTQQAAFRAVQIAAAANLEKEDYEQLREAKFKTEAESRSIDRYELEQRYQGLPADELLARADMEDKQLKGQVLLEFYLTIGRAHLKPDEQAIVDRESEDGPAFMPDLNRRLLGHKVHALEVLGIAELMNRGGDQLTNQDSLILKIGDRILQCHESLKITLGVDLDKKKDTIWKINYLVEQLLGWRLMTRLRTTGAAGETRYVVYEVHTSATSPTFDKGGADDDYPTVATPQELCEVRQRFINYLGKSRAAVKDLQMVGM